MTYPKKLRGWRAITIDEHRYRWKLWPSSPNSRLEVTGVRKGGQRLAVTLVDWQDPWLAISGMEVKEGSMTLLTAAANIPEVIASSFVREIIEFGLRHGWNPEASGTPRAVDSIAGQPVSRDDPDRSRPTPGSPEESEGVVDLSRQSLAPDSAGKEPRILTKAIRIYPAGR